MDIARQAPPDPRVRRAIPAVKEQEEVVGLPPFSDLVAEVVARNTYFTSNSSNELNFTTPEGGKWLNGFFSPNFMKNLM